ncbi:hypothetical protein PUR49_04490 [Streptomyces sp. BE147]|uniref:hypothetical protein n=1 Tax=Streptomyces sp. BE147 TaxID=3002524 RepID=UPI002E79D6B6|nr:hypothetical protein [Streptomyces sp. BE147]MEE1735775.1 hypothetical protein [Streptomyces sp. BE147]
MGEPPVGVRDPGSGRERTRGPGARPFDGDDRAEEGKADSLLDPLDGAGTKVALELSSLTAPDRQGLWKSLGQHYGELILGLQGDRLVELLQART